MFSATVLLISTNLSVQLHYQWVTSFRGTNNLGKIEGKKTWPRTRLKLTFFLSFHWAWANNRLLWAISNSEQTLSCFDLHQGWPSLHISRQNCYKHLCMLWLYKLSAIKNVCCLCKIFCIFLLLGLATIMHIMDYRTILHVRRVCKNCLKIVISKYIQCLPYY